MVVLIVIITVVPGSSSLQQTHVGAGFVGLWFVTWFGVVRSRYLLVDQNGKGSELVDLADQNFMNRLHVQHARDAASPVTS
jgi:hypothetical protein